MIILWWLIRPGRWETAFESAIWPVLGAIFIPWSTLMFVIVAPSGSVEAGDWGWLAVAFIADFFSQFGAFRNRGRLPRPAP
jgi:hypothetical protein